MMEISIYEETLKNIHKENINDIKFNVFHKQILININTQFEGLTKSL